MAQLPEPSLGLCVSVSHHLVAARKFHGELQGQEGQEAVRRLQDRQLFQVGAERRKGNELGAGREGDGDGPQANPCGNFAWGD